MSVTSIYLRSNVLTAAMVGLLWWLHSSAIGLLVWILLLVPYLLAMLWWVIQCDNIDHRLLPREPAPLADEPLATVSKFPPHYTTNTGPGSPTRPGYQPIRLIGASEKPRAIKPPRNL